MYSETPDRPPVGRPLLAAAIIILIFFGGFGTWAALAPLDSAALAPGRVTVASNRKTIQHLEGGIVKNLLVKEGDAVAGGQILIQLDDTQAGVVMGLNVHTEAGVIAPRQRLLDIVPEDDTLVIEAQVTPNDIDVVYAGLPAQVRLTAFKQRNTPMLDGKLIRVSADSFTDERSGASYFLARVAIDAAQLKKLDGRELYPGMGAEVMIKTGKRTTMDFILAPLTDSLRQAFRED